MSSRSWFSLPPRLRPPTAKRTRGSPELESGTIDPRLVPELEHREVPQPRRVIRPAGQVVVDEPPDDVRTEVVPGQSGAAEDDILQPVAKLAPEPGADGDPEALLAPVDEIVGETAASRELLEEPLGAKAAELRPWRKARGELLHSVVQERRPHLERVGHRHPVDLREQVVGEVGAHIQREVAVHALARRQRQHLVPWTPRGTGRLEEARIAQLDQPLGAEVRHQRGIALA